MNENDNVIKAYEYSLRFLAERPRSRFELNTRLKNRGFTDFDIEKTLDILESDGYLDDNKFSLWWIESCLNSRPRGIFGIKDELKSKGISKKIIEKALLTINMDFEKELNMAKSIKEKSASKFNYYNNIKDKNRLINSLKRRGFSWEVIETVIESLQ